MRVHRTKRAKKVLGLFEKEFGFHPPFQVIIDGTFAMSAITNRLQVEDRVTTYLGSKIQFLTTKCLVKEIDTLGETVARGKGMFGGAKIILKKFQTRKCKHKPCVSALSCVKAMVGKSNEHRYIIATQDPAVMQELKDIPGVPILTINGGRLFLMKPSRASVEHQHKKLEAKLNVSGMEEKVLKALNERHGLLRETVIKAQKKKKARGANPLSMKKSSTKGKQQQTKRKRTRHHKASKE
eukprot:m.19652 g.19652  ORF g.19652 m.19652 type:complete len:239 (+) comp5144_c0_seq2:1242-1958(+)